MSFPNEQTLYDQQTESNNFRNSPTPEYPQDSTKFLDGKAEFAPAGGGSGTIQGTLNVIQKGDGAGNAIDSVIQDLGIDGVHFFLGDLGHGALDLFSIKRLNFADLHLSGESGADIFFSAGAGGSFTIETDGGIGDPVILRCGAQGSGVSFKVNPDRISTDLGFNQTASPDTAGTLTLVAGTKRYNFVGVIGGGFKAIVFITPQAAPAGILSVIADATGFDVHSSNAGDTVTVNYFVVLVPA